MKNSDLVVFNSNTNSIKIHSDTFQTEATGGKVKTITVSLGISYNTLPILSYCILSGAYYTYNIIENINTSSFRFISARNSEGSGTRTIQVRWLSVGY